MPASGPGKSPIVSAMTGRPTAAKRAGSPLALRMRPSHCGFTRAITRSKILRPPIVRIGLSPPPMRRANPPASSTPGVASAPPGVASAPPGVASAPVGVAGAPLGVVGAPLGVAGISFIPLALARVARGLFRDKFQILVVDDALLPGQGDEALSARSSDQRQSDLAGEVDAPRGKPR